MADNMTAEERKKEMTYEERLARYEQDKMNIPRTADCKTYEATLKALAKKWKI